MKLFKKKTLVFLMALSFVLINSTYIFAEDNNDLAIDEASNTMNFFIDSNVNMGDIGWNGFEIVGYDNIYDADLIHYGYIFELSNGVEDGYGIVIKDRNYYVVEASNEMQSPYKNNNDLNIYYTPLAYYSASNTMTYSLETDLCDLYDGEIISNSDVTNIRYNVNVPLIQPASVPGESFKYISNYSAKFEKHKQVKNTSCIPASFSMSIKYLHNIGSLTLKTPYTNMDNIDNKLYELANCSGMCYAEKIKTAVEVFSDNYITGAKIRTKDDEFQPDTYLDVAQDEVDSNCPPIIIFYKGALSTNPNNNHATTMVGYKTVNNTRTGGITMRTSYIVVVDPWDKTTKTVLWNSNSVFGYMIIYFY